MASAPADGLLTGLCLPVPALRLRLLPRLRHAISGLDRVLGPRLRRGLFHFSHLHHNVRNTRAVAVSHRCWSDVDT